MWALGSRQHILAGTWFFRAQCPLAFRAWALNLRFIPCTSILSDNAYCLKRILKRNQGNNSRNGIVTLISIFRILNLQQTILPKAKAQHFRHGTLIPAPETLSQRGPPKGRAPVPIGRWTPQFQLGSHAPRQIFVGLICTMKLHRKRYHKFPTVDALFCSGTVRTSGLRHAHLVPQLGGHARRREYCNFCHGRLMMFTVCALD